MTDLRDPFERLCRSHRRLEERLDDLARAVREKNVVGLRDVCAFLDRQVRRHEEDEERSLFPRLREKDGTELVGVLEREHREHEALAARLERAVDALDRDEVDTDLAPAADAITSAYRKHIADEETGLFPLARTKLTPEELDVMAREMEERRTRM